MGTEGALTAIFQIFEQFFHRLFVELIVCFYGGAAGCPGEEFRADGIQTAVFVQFMEHIGEESGNIFSFSEILRYRIEHYCGVSGFFNVKSETLKQLFMAHQQ